MTRLILYVALAFVSACAKQEPPASVAARIEVVDEADRPVSGAKIELDGKSVGVTDSGGAVESMLKGPEGRQAKIGVTCPNGWVASEGETRYLKVRFVKPISKNNKTPAPLRAALRCAPKTRSHVLLVRTDYRSGLPINLLGRQASETDADGVAQILVEGTPGEEIEVTIDTSVQPDLRPAMPSRRFTMPRESRILVFDQEFEQRRSERKIGKSRRGRFGPRRL